MLRSFVVAYLLVGGVRADAAPPRWAMPRGARLVDIQAGVRERDRDDKMAPACAGFSLDEAQVRTFFRLARVISARELHDRHDQAPCVVTGKVVSDGSEAEWEISAAMVGWVKPAKGDETILACDARCTRAVLGKGAANTGR